MLHNLLCHFFYKRSEPKMADNITNFTTNLRLFFFSNYFKGFILRQFSWCVTSFASGGANNLVDWTIFFLIFFYL